MAAQLKMATITFDDDAKPVPMVMKVVPSATRLSAVKDFDEAVFWCLRGAGQADGGATFCPGLSAAQVAHQVFNAVHECVILRRTEYPFPVHMTDFVVLALCSSALERTCSRKVRRRRRRRRVRLTFTTSVVGVSCLTTLGTTTPGFYMVELTARAWSWPPERRVGRQSVELAARA